MKLNLTPELMNLIQALKVSLPKLQQAKAEARARVRKERRCTGTTEKGEPCRAWSVWGDANKKCFRHGGAETAKLPRSERRPACTCEAYNFPHRHGSGACNSPEEPLQEHPTPQGQRRNYKRIRKAKFKRRLKSMGV